MAVLRLLRRLNTHTHGEPVRVRFAPSPTGSLHLGGLRTALYNYIVARQSGPEGRFVLRIEDTDQTRLVPGAAEKLAQSLRWAGLSYDEGPDIGGPYGPYIQSQRLPIYRAHTQELIEQGHAYRCFCSVERLEQLRLSAQARKQSFVYDRHCLGLSKADVEARVRAGESHTVRLKVPEGTTSVTDLVYGRVDFSNLVIDDQVLLKSDGYPTYHLANVIDDHLMQITHVIRGEEWLSSTSKHIMLYRGFGWKEPRFAHLPLLLNVDKSKLSKRNGDVDVALYQKDYLHEALVNFVAFLGWAPSSAKEVFQIQELINEFALERVHKGGAVVMRAKLDWFNKQHIDRLSTSKQGMDSLHERLLPLFEAQSQTKWLSAPALSGYQWKWQDPSYLTSVIHAVKERTTLLADIPTLFSYFFAPPDWDSVAAKALLAKLNQSVLGSFADTLSMSISQLVRMKPSGELIWDFSKETITQTELNKESVSSAEEHALGHAVVKSGQQFQIEYKQSMMMARYLVSATAIGPSIGILMFVLGPEETLGRIQRFRPNVHFIDK